MFLLIKAFDFSGISDQTIWQLSGAQGQTWQQAQAPINQTSKSYRVVFEGKRGTSYTGDIAIDDISFTSSACGGMILLYMYRELSF